MRLLQLTQLLLLASTTSSARSTGRGRGQHSRRADAVLVDLAPFTEAGAFKTWSIEDLRSSGSMSTSELQPDPEEGSRMEATAAAECTNPAIRVEWRRMADADKQAFLGAVNCLLRAPSKGGYPGSTNRYEDVVSVHQQMAGRIHDWAQFLPWHRQYLVVYESLLRNECGYRGAMPWWDETLDAGHFSTSPVFGTPGFGPAPFRVADSWGVCVQSGVSPLSPSAGGGKKLTVMGSGQPFANLTLHLGPGVGFTKHCLSRALVEQWTEVITQEAVDNCQSHGNYFDMEQCTNYGPHGYGHNGIGAVMSEPAASPGDPVFFMHHAFIDRMWRIWQNLDEPNRNYQINGWTDARQTEQITLDYVLDLKGLAPNVTVRDVVYTRGGKLCYRYDY